jgi:hypothetical protein
MDSSREKTFTNKINCNLNKILKTLSNKPRGKIKQWIKYLPKLTREEGRNKPCNVSSPSSIVTLQMY